MANHARPKTSRSLDLTQKICNRTAGGPQTYHSFAKEGSFTAEDLKDLTPELQKLHELLREEVGSKADNPDKNFMKLKAMVNKNPTKALVDMMAIAIVRSDPKMYATLVDKIDTHLAASTNCTIIQRVQQESTKLASGSTSGSVSGSASNTLRSRLETSFPRLCNGLFTRVMYMRAKHLLVELLKVRPIRHLLTSHKDKEANVMMIVVSELLGYGMWRTMNKMIFAHMDEVVQEPAAKRRKPMFRRKSGHELIKEFEARYMEMVVAVFHDPAQRVTIIENAEQQRASAFGMRSTAQDYGEQEEQQYRFAAWRCVENAKLKGAIPAKWLAGVLLDVVFVTWDDLTEEAKKHKLRKEAQTEFVVLEAARIAFGEEAAKGLRISSEAFKEVRHGPCLEEAAVTAIKDKHCEEISYVWKATFKSLWFMEAKTMGVQKLSDHYAWMMGMPSAPSPAPPPTSLGARGNLAPMLTAAFRLLLERGAAQEQVEELAKRTEVPFELLPKQPLEPLQACEPQLSDDWESLESALMVKMAEDLPGDDLADLLNQDTEMDLLDEPDDIADLLNSNQSELDMLQLPADMDP